MTARTLGVGLIGTGYMGKCHALAWGAVAATFGEGLRPKLVHLGEANADLAVAKGRELGFPRASGDWRAVIADPEVEIVSITTPNRFHAEMAVAALEAGKHVWCEKPMATSLADAERMARAAAARPAGKVVALGYNYIQSPAIRQIEKLVKAGAIGRLTNVRLEMDEDFMADGSVPFGEKDAAASGHGALDDFGVHPLSLLSVLAGLPSAVLADQARPTPTRLSGGVARPVETHDIATVLLRFPDGLSGSLQLNRAAWGRKGRIALQLMGDRGTILFDQERANEFQLYTREAGPALEGFKTILIGPTHPPYDRFLPAPGHGLGFNDLKVIEAYEILAAIEGRPARLIDFAEGLRIERLVHAMARSAQAEAWVTAA